MSDGFSLVCKGTSKLLFRALILPAIARFGAPVVVPHTVLHPCGCCLNSLSHKQPQTTDQMAALRLCALLLVSVESLHLTRHQVLRSVSLSPIIALPALADDDLKGLLGAVVENEANKQAKRDADAALEEKLSKMSAGERIRYERAPV